MEEIGSPVPKGVVDVQKDFVGILPQEMNPDKELARLRRQMRQIRTRAENLGLLAANPRRQMRRLAELVVIAGIAGFAFALWRLQTF
ncbi:MULTISPECIES: hypothetical protein [unclassified Rhizobium]|uniref:hypothetical protein n=1 Tax=unclassified Rhizobium TaxID=2613769 RepID=UPI0006FB9E24|nr:MULTISPECIES: hypothetical protein [unclassified Rhizobium]KQV37655.1 hypothetical protein ASC86_23825 [Rhizobium sp. Root1212]KRD34557.1 hypothetical protein ASE37_22395 [Rhizobium sp. Root268]